MGRGFCIALLFWSVSGLATDFSKLHYTTEEYPPLSYQQNDGMGGVSVDLLHLVWQELAVAPQPITLMPWARAYYEILNDDDRVLFSVARTPAREALFQWACPILETQYVLLAKADSDIQQLQPEALPELRIGTVRGDVGEELLINRLGSERNLYSNTSLRTNLELLDRGRIDLVIFYGRLANVMIRRFGLDPEQYRVVYELESAQVCYAFSKSLNPAVVAEFQKALNKVVARPEYEALLRQYDIE